MMNTLGTNSFATILPVVILLVGFFFLCVPVYDSVNRKEQKIGTLTLIALVIVGMLLIILGRFMLFGFL